MFRYTIVDRKIYLSESVRRAGEIAFGRPSGLDLSKSQYPARHGPEAPKQGGEQDR